MPPPTVLGRILGAWRFACPPIGGLLVPNMVIYSLIRSNFSTSGDNSCYGTKQDASGKCPILATLNVYRPTGKQLCHLSRCAWKAVYHLVEMNLHLLPEWQARKVAAEFLQFPVSRLAPQQKDLNFKYEEVQLWNQF